MSDTLTWKDLKPQLDADIPRSAVAQRDSGAGRKLDYLTSWYVIARLNEVFGAGTWGYNIQTLNKVFEGEVKGKFYTSYIATVTLTIGNQQWTDVGFGDGQDSTNPGKTHELATKEAVSDALKRCAKNLGWSFGNALYDKSQEHVSDEQPAAKAPVAQPKAAAVVAAPGPSVKPAELVPTVSRTKDETVSLIRAATRTLVNMKKMTIDEVKHRLVDDFKVLKADELSPEAADRFLAYLDTQLAN